MVTGRFDTFLAAHSSNIEYIPVTDSWILSKKFYLCLLLAINLFYFFLMLLLFQNICLLNIYWFLIDFYIGICMMTVLIVKMLRRSAISSGGRFSVQVKTT